MSGRLIRAIHPLMASSKVLWAMLLGGMLGAACGSSAPYVPVQSLKQEETVRRIATGDTIGVTVRNQNDLSGSYVVRENGTYAQPVIGQIGVEGLTEVEAAQRIADALQGAYQNPQVQVVITKPRPVRVAVLGEVRTGGQYQVEYDESVLSVLARAGGLTPFADRDGIYVIRKRPELRRIRFKYDDLKGGEPASNQFRLHDGDVIVVE